MLIHHFEAETQGFQRLVDQNELGKAYVRDKSHFLKETFFFFFWGGGVPAFLTILTKDTSSPMHIIHENMFVFYLACSNPE